MKIGNDNNRSTYTWNDKVMEVAKRVGRDIRSGESSGVVFEE